MKGKYKRRLIKNIIERGGYFILYFSTMWLLILCEGNGFSEFFVLVGALIIFALLCFFPEEILFEIEARKRSEKY